MGDCEAEMSDGVLEGYAKVLVGGQGVCREVDDAVCKKGRGIGELVSSRFRPTKLTREKN